MNPKRRHQRTGELTISIVVKDGKQNILEFKEKKVSALDEVLETLKRKL